jgi:hypothetical protein
MAATDSGAPPRGQGADLPGPVGRLRGHGRWHRLAPGLGHVFPGGPSLRHHDIRRRLPRRHAAPSRPLDARCYQLFVRACDFFPQRRS